MGSEMCIRDSSINGQLKQEASTALMVHSVDDLLSHLKGWYGLESGDLVWTGTPKGVSPMNPGDVIEAWMENMDGERTSRLSAICK